MRAVFQYSLKRRPFFKALTVCWSHNLNQKYMSNRGRDPLSGLNIFSPAIAILPIPTTGAFESCLHFHQFFS